MCLPTPESPTWQAFKPEGTTLLGVAKKMVSNFGGA